MDVSDLWMGKTDQSLREEFLHYTSQGQLEGLRQGDWKLLVKKPRQNRNAQQQASKTQTMLFNLKSDLSETKNVAEEHPKIVQRLKQRMTELDAEITMNARSPWLMNE